MKHYSPVGPKAVLQMLEGADLLGDYLLVLPQEVNKDPEFYARIREKVKYIILDNGVIELGEPAPHQMMIEAMNNVLPDTVVLSDVLGDAMQTIQASHSAARRYREEGFGGHLMGVPQGRTHIEMVWCAMQLANECDVTAWGIPRLITNSFGSRKPLVEALGGKDMEPRGAHIHLLGMSGSIIDDVQCARMKGVMGIDSANPLIMGLTVQELGVDPYLHVSGHTKKLYWDLTPNSWRQLEFGIPYLMQDNVRTLRSHINNDSNP